MLEIERKFLLKDNRWRAEVEHSRTLKQAFLGGEGVSVRVRISGEQATLNIKELKLGISHQEFEYPIPLDEAERMMALAKGGRIDKTRHHVRRGPLMWEIDEFHGDNEGLIVAEVELDDPRQPVDLPDWIGDEVTHVERYYNVALAVRPFSYWNEPGD